MVALVSKELVMRYLLNEESGVIHDTRSNCDDAENHSLTPLTYKAFVLAVREGADPCDHCFRSDEIGKPEASEVSEIVETESPLSFPGDAAESNTFTTPSGNVTVNGEVIYESGAAEGETDIG